MLSGSRRLLAVHKKSVVEQGFVHEFAFDHKALKTFDEFRICENVRSSNSDFVTSLDGTDEGVCRGQRMLVRELLDKELAVWVVCA